MIKVLFNPGEYSTRIDTVLLLLRVGIGIFMLTHGMGKFTRLFGDEPIRFSDPLGVGAPISLALAVFAEFFCSLLLIVGFATRAAAIPLLITMLVAALIVHATDGFGKQELPLLHSLVYLSLLIAGPGRFSIDHLIWSKYGSAQKGGS
ncbi:MAG: DoxX family protein [Flavobacteriales bacterium]